MRPVLLSVLALLILALPAQAQTVGEALTFKRVGLFDLTDQTQKGYGQKIGELLRKEIEGTFRFEVLRRTETIHWPVQSEEILRLSQRAGVDLVLAGKAGWADKALKLTLILWEGKTGAPFAVESDLIKEWKEPEGLDQAVRGLVRKLISRVPYKALVTEVKDEKVRFDAGALHGVEKGLKASVTEITEVTRHPFTREIIGFKIEEIAQLTVTEVNERSSIATLLHVEKGKAIKVNQKIRFVPSQAALALAEAQRKEQLARQEQERVALEAQRRPAPPKPIPTAPTEKIQLALQTSLLTDTFDFDSNELTFARKAKGILTLELQGDVWFGPSWGLGLAYRQGGIQFDEVDNNPMDVNATPRWIQGGVRYRYRLKAIETAPAVAATVGYQLYQFEVDQRDPTFFVEYAWQGPFLELEGDFPVSSRLGFETTLAYLPLMDYREESVNSGTVSRAMSYRIQAGGHYRFGKRVEVALGYSYEKYMADFSGVGTRGDAGVTDSRVEETYNGFNLNLIALF
jgi:hypothetical protein